MERRLCSWAPWLSTGPQPSCTYSGFRMPRRHHTVEIYLWDSRSHSPGPSGISLWLVLGSLARTRKDISSAPGLLKISIVSSGSGSCFFSSDDGDHTRRYPTHPNTQTYYTLSNIFSYHFLSVVGVVDRTESNFWAGNLCFAFCCGLEQHYFTHCPIASLPRSQRSPSQPFLTNLATCTLKTKRRIMGLAMS